MDTVSILQKQLELVRRQRDHYYSCANSMMNSGYVSFQWGHKGNFEKKLHELDALQEELKALNEGKWV